MISTPPLEIVVEKDLELWKCVGHGRYSGFAQPGINLSCGNVENLKLKPKDKELTKKPYCGKI